MKSNLRPNPFYLWYSTNFKGLKLGRYLFSLIGLFLGQLAVVSGVINDYWPILNKDHFVNLNLSLQGVLLIVALLHFIPELRHFDSERFIAELTDKLQRKNIIDKLSNIPKSNITMAINKHTKFTQNAILLVGLLLCSHIIIFITRRVPDAHLNSHKFLASVSLVLNSIAIWTLMACYYLLTYFKGTESFVRNRMALLVGFLALGTFVGISICCYQDSISSFTEMCRLIYGIAGILVGIAFSLMASRLADISIGTPTPIISVLLAYGIFQGYYFVFADVVSNQSVINTVLISTFVFKAFTLTFLYWIIRCDRIIIYSICNPYLMDITTNWRDYLADSLEEIEIDNIQRYKEARK